MKTKVLPTDVVFTMPRRRGSGCLCSRCLLPIVNHSPVKRKKDKYELRYHPQCWKFNARP